MYSRHINASPNMPTVHDGHNLISIFIKVNLC